MKPTPQFLRIFLLAVVLLAASPAHSESLLNLKFGSGFKLGPAAMGIGTNDFWNHYNPTNTDGTLFDSGVLVPLYSADGTNVAAGMLVYGVQTSGTNATGDGLLDTWLAASGTNLTLILTNVPYGVYDVYVYGHGDAAAANGLYQLISAWNNYGNLATTNTAEWNPSVWTEGAQFVVYRDVALPAGQAILLQVSPNDLGFALLNGLQLVGKPIPAGDADGDGLSNAEELQRGTNPFAASTTGDGVSDFVKVRQGRNPLAAATLDTAGALGFEVFTLLR